MPAGQGRHLSVFDSDTCCVPAAHGVQHEISSPKDADEKPALSLQYFTGFLPL